MVWRSQFFVALASTAALATGCASEPPPAYRTCELDWPAPAPNCGNGQLDEGELCDDSNTQDDDGCDRDCQPSSIEDIAVSNVTLCARFRSGWVRCWGANLRMETALDDAPMLGTRPASDAYAIPTCGPVDEMAGDPGGMCLRSGGNVACFGSRGNAALGLGDGTELDIGDFGGTLPWLAFEEEVNGLRGKDNVMCAGLDDGTFHCWGGAPGWFDDTYAPRNPSAAHVLPGHRIGDDSASRIVDLAPGSHLNCLIDAEGDVYCFGQSRTMGFGYGTGSKASFCVEEGVVSCGDDPTCCIGDDEAHTAFGAIALPAPATKIDVERDQACALLDTGAVFCWGGKDLGTVLPNEENVVGDDETPADVGPILLGAPAVDIDVADDHACAVLEGGDLHCWGLVLGQPGQEIVGDDEELTELEPMDVGGAVRKVRGLLGGACVLLEDDSIRCWNREPMKAAGHGNTIYGDDEPPSAAPAIRFW